MLLAIFIRVSTLCYESKLLGIENFSDPKFSGKDPSGKALSDNPWRAVPARAPEPDRKSLS